MKRTLLTYLLTLVAFVTYAQTGQVSGRIVDAESGEGLFGANAAIKGTSKGATADFDGAFTITGVEPGDHVFVISYVGYDAFEKAITVRAGEAVNLGDLKLQGGALNLEAVKVMADVAVDRKTPVAVSTIKPEMIEAKLGNQEFPEILKTTPGVYATKSGGGFGDSRINVRGFNSNNVAVMINGVPVNDMESGWVYWSNWAGLSDVTRSQQVQRGLGASKVAVPSVGGTINILTKTTDMKKGGNLMVGTGNNGRQKVSLSLSTGLMENGWAVTVLGAKNTGDGYVKGTQFEGYSYFFNVAKQINDKHQLSLTGFGAPQWHGQRRNRMSIADYKKYGLQHNQNYGYMNGELMYESKNYYHKPQFSLNHFWTVNDKMNVTTTAYLSTGTGGGTGSKGTWLRNEDGTPNFDAMVAQNQEAGVNGSVGILRSSRNDHFWYGFLTSADYKVNENINLLGGIDIRNYKGEHYRTADNMLGGQSWKETNDINRVPGTYTVWEDGQQVEKKMPYTVNVGDKMDYNNDGLVQWYGGFLQGEYSNDIVSAFVSTSITSVSYQRVDYFNYLDSDPEQTSDWVNFLGYSVKGGANYNLSENHNVFANAGYFERAPFFSNVFLNYKNDLNPDAKNEKVLSFELGYGFRSKTFTANLNAYYTKWMDRGLVETLPYKVNGETEYYTANLTGVEALHKGIEMEVEWKPVTNLTVRGAGSIGDWIWNNNIENVRLFDEDQNLVSVFNMNMKGLKIGDAAQTNASLGVDYKVFEGANIGATFVYFDKLFADYDPTDYAVFTDEEISGGSEVDVQPWQIPSYGLLDLNASYKFKMAGLNAKVFGNVYNVLDQTYVSEAMNGDTNNWNSAQVYYGFGRTWSLSMKLEF